MSWFEDAFVYQIYPLGLCACPHENDGVVVHRLNQIVDNGWIEHMQRLGVTCLLLNPVFQSSSHGYDTIDYTKLDCRLGVNEDLAQLVTACHDAGIRVLMEFLTMWGASSGHSKMCLRIVNQVLMPVGSASTGEAIPNGTMVFLMRHGRVFRIL